MLKSVTLRSQPNVNWFIPGFVNIDDMHAIDDGRFGANFSVVYDTDKLNQIKSVNVVSSPDSSPAGTRSVGKLHINGSQPVYVYYTAEDGKTSHVDRTVCVVGSLAGMEFYLPGFIGVDKISKDEFSEQIRVYARYNPAGSQVRRVKIRSIGVDPGVGMPAGATNLGLYEHDGGWTYLVSTEEIIPFPN
ncbi:hypothetical protein ACIP5Y_33060 [Nocardia sp. NPDC088792]|uniref:hypothetical protein n=1 Tax=Nocardia sp. NPDC088792 TaxID=3364332 RepID=UPI0037FCCC6B